MWYVPDTSFCLSHLLKVPISPPNEGGILNVSVHSWRFHCILLRGRSAALLPSFWDLWSYVVVVLHARLVSGLGSHCHALYLLYYVVELVQFIVIYRLYTNISSFIFTTTHRPEVFVTTLGS